MIARNPKVPVCRSCGDCFFWLLLTLTGIRVVVVELRSPNTRSDPNQVPRARFDLEVPSLSLPHTRPLVAKESRASSTGSAGQRQ